MTKTMDDLGMTHEEQIDSLTESDASAATRILALEHSLARAKHEWALDCVRIKQLETQLAAARDDAVREFAEWVTGQEFEVQVKIETQKITMAPDAADRFLAATGTVRAVAPGVEDGEKEGAWVR